MHLLCKEKIKTTTKSNYTKDAKQWLVSSSSSSREEQEQRKEKTSHSKDTVLDVKNALAEWYSHGVKVNAISKSIEHLQDAVESSCSEVLILS